MDWLRTRAVRHGDKPWVLFVSLVSFVDHQVGRLMAALKQTGLIGNTRVIYTSDHGDNLSARGLWGKSNMYQDPVAVPLIMAGPEIPAGFVCHEPVSLVDGSGPSSSASARRCTPTIAICPALRCST